MGFSYACDPRDWFLAGQGRKFKLKWLARTVGAKTSTQKNNYKEERRAQPWQGKCLLLSVRPEQGKDLQRHEFYPFSAGINNRLNQLSDPPQGSVEGASVSSLGSSDPGLGCGFKDSRSYEFHRYQDGNTWQCLGFLFVCFWLHAGMLMENSYSCKVNHSYEKVKLR